MFVYQHIKTHVQLNNLSGGHVMKLQVEQISTANDAEQNRLGSVDEILVAWLKEQCHFSESDVEFILSEKYKEKRVSPNKAIKLLSMAFNYLGQALNTTGNTLLYRTYNQTAVASLANTFQSCFRNTLNGGMAASGKMISGQRNSGDEIDQQEMIVTSYLLGFVSAAITTTIYGASYFILPKVVDKETGTLAAYYLLASGLGNWPMLNLTMLQQFAYAYDHWVAQIVTTLMSRIPPVALSYLLLRETNLIPAVSIGLGNMIAPVLVYGAMEVWCRRQPDLKKFMRMPFVAFKNQWLDEQSALLNEGQVQPATSCWKNIRVASSKHFKPMLKLFAELAFQRATEWVNVFISTLVLGAMKNKNLAILTAALQVMSIFNLFSQGIGTGVTMDAEQEKKGFDRILKSSDQIDSVGKNNIPPELIPPVESIQNDLLEQADTHYHNLKNIVILSQLLGLIVNGSVAIGTYFMRHMIVSWFANADDSPSQNEEAAKVLYMVAIGLVADSVRLISCGSLVPWNRNLLTNIVSLVSMTIIGIPLGYAIAKQEPENQAYYLFGVVRTIMIAVAAAVNIAISVNELKKDCDAVRKKKESLQTLVNVRPLHVSLSPNSEVSFAQPTLGA